MHVTIGENVPITQKDNQRPFPGLMSFGEKNKAAFGGRDAEIKELFNLVENHRLTIVFGKSGIGKTSLINAGLIPQLQKNFYLPIYCRIDFSSEKKPIDQLKAIISQKVKLSDKASPEIGNRTLWEYFSENNIMDGIVKPVIILDQFEEIFTVGRDKNQEAFLTELSDLAENRIPLVVQKQYENTAEMISLKFQDQHYRVIISLREDYLAQLESLKARLPSIKDSRFRVEQLTVEQAMDAVLKPAGNLADEAVAAQIIKKLPGLSDHVFGPQYADHANTVKVLIEPFLLSLICYQVNEKRIDQKMEKITAELVLQFDISNVIRTFYNDTLQSFDVNISQMIENTLLTESGYRKLQSLEELERDYNVNAADIQKLIESRIIRKELRDDVEYVELIHDVLVPVIKEQRNKRLIEKNEQEKNKAIKRGIELYRLKRNRNIRNALYVVVPVLVMLAYSLIRKSQQLAGDAIKHENIILAKRLLVTSSSPNIDTLEAANISRAAYLLNKIGEGEEDIAFYNSMYERMGTLGGKFHFPSLTDSSKGQIRVLANAGNDTFFFGSDWGKIYKASATDNLPRLLFDFKERITSVSISPGKRYLAVAGTFNYIRIFDIIKTTGDFFDLQIKDTAGNGKMVRFANDSTLMVSLGSTLAALNIYTHQSIARNNAAKVYMLNRKRLAGNINASENYFETTMGKSLSMAVSKDKIALGMDSGLILITKDTVSVFTSSDVQYPTSLAFDPQLRYLFIGTRDGSVHRMKLSNTLSNSSQYQVSRITDMNFSPDGTYMASASFDGSVAVWTVDADWNVVTPLRIFPPKEYLYFLGDINAAYSISFEKNNQYFLAGYANGGILKWPVSTEVLSNLICAKTDSSFNAAFLSKYILRKETVDELISYKCK